MNVLRIFQDLMELIASNYISIGILIVIVSAAVIKLLFTADEADGFVKFLLYLPTFALLGVMADLIVCIVTP